MQLNRILSCFLLLQDWKVSTIVQKSPWIRSTTICDVDRLPGLAGEPSGGIFDKYEAVPAVCTQAKLGSDDRDEGKGHGALVKRLYEIGDNHDDNDLSVNHALESFIFVRGDVDLSCINVFNKPYRYDHNPCGPGYLLSRRIGLSQSR